MNRGSILRDDLTYTMLHEMVMKKFKLEASYPLNLSAKLSSIDDNFDITDDDENNESNHQNESQFEEPEFCFAFGDYNEYEDEKNEFDDVVDDNPLPNYQKLQQYMSFKPDIPETPLYKSKPMISKDYKKETDVKLNQIFDNKAALDLAIRLKALDEGYQFLNDRSAPDRHAAIALAVHNEFPLAYHGVCYRHLMMNLSLKRDKTKALFWKICKAYTTEEFSSSMSHLHDIQPDAYDKLCQISPDRWSKAHCPLARYNYLTSNSMESVNACTVVYRKLLVLKLAETYRVMVQDWYYKRRKTGTCQCHKWQLSRLPCGHVIAVTSNLENVTSNVLVKLQEALDEEAISEEQILTLMHRFVDRFTNRRVKINNLMVLQDHPLIDYGKYALGCMTEADIQKFTNRRVKINNLMVLQDHPLIDYGKYALGCMTEADIKKCVHLKSVRDELLRSMKEKRQLMTNYRDM
nr:transposase, MuDR, MULE transposase domain protein [Tanacetum cinerariifolium]